MAVALEDLRRARRGLEAQPLAGDPFDLRVDRGVLAHRARASRRASRRAPARGARGRARARPAGELQPEGRRLGVPVCPPHAERLAMLFCLREDGVERALEPFEDEAPAAWTASDCAVSSTSEEVDRVEPAAVLAEVSATASTNAATSWFVSARAFRDPFRRRRMCDSAHPLDRGRRHDADRAPAVECRSTSSMRPSLASSDQIRVMAGRA